MNIKRPEKMNAFEEKWILIHKALLNKLADADYRLDDLTIDENFSVLGLVGISLFDAVNLYRQLVDLHHQYNDDDEIRAYKKEQKSYIENELNKIFGE